MDMNVPITQSKMWQKLQEDLGERSIFKQNKKYQFLAIIKSTSIGNYLYCPYGPVAEEKETFREAIDQLMQIAEQENSIFIRIEPQECDFRASLPKNSKKTIDLNPKETWLLDLTGDDNTFKARLPERLLRYHKTANSKGITLRSTKNPSDIKYLITLQNELAKQKGINVFPKNYLKTELSQPFATLYLAEYHEQNNSKESHSQPAKNTVEPVSGNIIAAGLVFDDSLTRYNLQGAQSELGRKLHATGILTIELIKQAREKGLKCFDFWGIAPEDAPENHPWANFTRFKKTFHGVQKEYLGTYDIPVDKMKYEIYQTLRKLNRKRRKA